MAWSGCEKIFAVEKSQCDECTDPAKNQLDDWDQLESDTTSKERFFKMYSRPISLRTIHSTKHALLGRPEVVLVSFHDQLPACPGLKDSCPEETSK